VTLSQEGDIAKRILGLGLSRKTCGEVTTTANALISAYRSHQPTVLTRHSGAPGGANDVVVVLLAARRLCHSFQMGAISSLARWRGSGIAPKKRRSP